MARQRIHAWLGIQGLAADENARARRCSEWLDFPAIAVALWILLVWYLEASQRISPQALTLHHWAVWLFFAAETGILLWMVDKPVRYLRRNWLNPLILLAGIPLLLGYLPSTAQLGVLRLLLVVDISVKVSPGLQRLLSTRHFGVTLLIVVLFTMAAGLMIDIIDPGIANAGEGIWWAWATMTSTGYGDVVPISEEGRAFGVLVMVFGTGATALITASLLAFLTSSREETTRQQERERRQLQHLESRLEAIESKLDTLLAQQQADDSNVSVRGEKGDGNSPS